MVWDMILKSILRALAAFVAIAATAVLFVAWLSGALAMALYAVVAELLDRAEQTVEYNTHDLQDIYSL